MNSRPDRLREIADRFNLDQNAVLDNVLYARAYTSEHQFELLDFVAAKFYEEAGVFKLLVSHESTSWIIERSCCLLPLSCQTRYDSSPVVLYVDSGLYNGVV